MNIPILLAALLSLIAFAAHAFIGDRELTLLRPGRESDNKKRETWIQSRAGWHWVSVDLLLSSLLLLLIAATNFIQAKTEILAILAIYFLLCGLAWLGTVWFSRNDNRQLIILGQWIFCWIMVALIVWGRGQFG